MDEELVIVLKHLNKILSERRVEPRFLAILADQRGQQNWYRGRPIYFGIDEEQPETE